MKVSHCFRTFFPETKGGIEQVILEIARQTEETEVLTLAKKPGEVSLHGLPVRAARRWLSIASCCIGPGVVRNLYRSNAELVHLHFPWPFGDIAYMFGGRGRPLIVTYHADIIRQQGLLKIYYPLMHWLLGRADRIVATSPNYLASSAILQKFSHKVEVIPLGISEAGYPTPDASVISKLKGQYGKGFMLFIGVLRYYKGLEFLIRASQPKAFPIVIAGAGGEENKLRALARSLDADNVHFLGRVDEETKMALLSLCGAVVFPSHLRSEAFGVTLLEGMMAKKPLISCEINTGTSFVNQNGKTGHVIPPGDVPALRAAMLDLWSNPDRAESWGRAARERFDTIFTGEKMAAAYEKLYRKVLQERSPVKGASIE